MYNNSVNSIKERCVILGRYLVENRSTVRAAANEFGISKSTVHKDVTQILKWVDVDLYCKVKEVLDINKRERHLRGGEATRKKYVKNEI
ncbi:MAG: sporulation transcriptional regulator SpoIIID [Clostridia bacterium]|nr:sporulation transcriptional regulator SpoIIID [Clostridia bacterium]